MYEDTEKRINWALILKRILMIILALLLIFGFIALVTKCSRNENENDSATPVDLTEQLNIMQDATLKYITKDNLPTDINASKTIKLKYLINKDLVSEIKDSEGNTCSENSSYAEITKLENNYAVKISLTCGQNSDYKIIYIGCFDSCQDGEVCVGDENSTGGICGVVETEEETTNTNNTTNNNSTQSVPSTNKTPTTNTKKPTTSTNDKNTSSNNTNTGNNNQTSNLRTLYEYEKCNKKYVCDSGTLTLDRDCVEYKYKTVSGQVVKKTNKVPATVKTNTTTEYHNSTSVSNTSYKFVTYRIENYYTYKGFVSGKGWAFERKQTIYSCSSGTIDGNYCITTTNTCADSSYTYNKSNNTCTKRKAIPYYTDSRIEKTCETTWSYSTTLPGWTRTGKTKLG